MKTFSLCRHICTDRTPQKEQYNPSRTTSFPEFCQHTRISPSIYGAVYFLKAIFTLNLLRPSRINPTLSAHAQLHGLFDFNATPFAPPGTKVIVHQKPKIRKSWAPRGKDGWYIYGAKDHYRCYNIYVLETQSSHTARHS